MAKVPETYIIGDKSNLTPERLLEIMLDMYKDLATQLNKKPDLYERDSDGLTTDTFLSNGDMNINTSTRKVEMLTEHTTSTSVNWTQLS